MNKIMTVLFVMLTICIFFSAEATTNNLIKGENSEFWKINFYGGNKKGAGSFNTLENGHSTPCINIACFGQKVHGQAISSKIAVSPGEKFKFNFKAKSIKGKVTVQLRFVSKENKSTGKYVLHVKMNPNDWGDAAKLERIAFFFGVDKNGKESKKVTTSFKNPVDFIVPVDTEFVRVYLFNSGVGATLFKDITLINLSEKKVKSGKQFTKIKDKALAEEAKRLLIDKKSSFKKDTEKFRGKRLELEIKDVELSTDYNMTTEKFPERATNIRVNGSNLTRNGKSVFLIGVESQANVFPWRNRILGVDFVHLADPYVFATTKYKIKNGKMKIWSEPYKWMEVQIRELLKNGLAVYVQPVEGSSVYKAEYSPFARELKKHGAIANTSHFLGFRPDNAIGIQLRNNFWKSILKITRKYPIFMYELYNEVRYTDYSPVNIIVFRESMHDKYKTIDYANKTWGTSFESFAAVTPPVKDSSYASAEFQIEPENFSRMLWRDWAFFIEKRFGKHLLEMRHFIKKYETNPNSYLTVQSLFDMPMGYVSLGGAYPEEVIKSEDIFGMELGGVYRDQFNGEENIYEIKQMLKSSFIRNCIGNISSNKPIIGEECKVNKYNKIPNTKQALINLHGEWKFKEDNEQKGIGEKYSHKDFNDTGWAQIKIPGMWGKQGFPNCITGWCRKDFFVPETVKDKQVFLNGKELADNAKIYLNGKLIGNTKRWNEEFSIDVADLLIYGEQNVLAIQISCKYNPKNFFWGGIRNFISLNVAPFFKTPRLTEGEMRDWLWGQVINGFSGIVMSYTYPADFHHHSMFRPDRYQYEAIRAIPKIKKEINSLGDIILPRPRLKAKTAMLFPFETGRAHIYKDRAKFHQAPLLSDILDFYCSALFKQLDIDVISNDILLRKGLDKYQMFMLAGCPRVQEGTVEKLENFVKEGGVLIVNHDSMKFEDKFNSSIPTPDFFGVKVGDNLKESDTVFSEEFDLKASKTVKSEFKLSFGVHLVSENAKIIAKYANGKAAITMNNYGKGKVYYIGCELDYNAINKVIAGIVDKNKIEKALDISSDKPVEFIEAHSLGRNGKYVWYIVNWGGGERILNVVSKNIPDGSYRIVDIVKNKVVIDNISAEVLKKGVSVSIRSHDPAVLLIEDIKLDPTKIEILTDKEQKMIDLWRPSPESETKVLLCSSSEIMGKSKMLTALNMLENFGFEFHLGMNEINNRMETFNKEKQEKNISDYQVLVSLGNKYARKLSKADNALKKYVMNGGGLLLAANHYVGPHSWLSNKQIKPLANPFGVIYTNTNIEDTEKYDFVPAFPTFTDIMPNEITKGVKIFQSRGMSMLKVNNPKAEILIKAGENSNMPGAPVMTSLKLGKGRVIIMGDAKWMKPDQLCKGDNAQLLMNIFNWLAKKPIIKYDKTQLEKLIDYKFE